MRKSCILNYYCWVVKHSSCCIIIIIILNIFMIQVWLLVEIRLLLLLLTKSLLVLKKRYHSIQETSDDQVWQFWLTGRKRLVLVVSNEYLGWFTLKLSAELSITDDGWHTQVPSMFSVDLVHLVMYAIHDPCWIIIAGLYENRCIGCVCSPWQDYRCTKEACKSWRNSQIFSVFITPCFPLPSHKYSHVWVCSPFAQI